MSKTKTPAGDDAQAKADAEAAAKAKAGPVCKEEVRFRGKTYAIGARLPADVPADALARLTEVGAI